MPERVFTPVLGWAPTAQPSVGFVVKTEYKPKPGATGSGIAMLVHVAPLNQAVSAFPVLLSKPTVHPLPPPAVLLQVSTWTDLQIVVEGETMLAAPPTVQIPPLLIVEMIVLPDPTIHPWFESEK